MSSDWSVATQETVNPSVRVLFVAARADADLFVSELKRAGLEITFDRVETVKALSDALAGDHWDIVIADYSLPRVLGSEALEIVRRYNGDLPLLFITENAIEDKAVTAMFSGAQDCIDREHLRRLAAVVRREIDQAKLRHERAQAQQRLHYLAYHDPITTLPNHAYLHDRLEQAILNAQRRGCRGALLTLKVNEFREINESFGHQVADLVLRHVGARLQAALPESCELACLRANEFAILVPSLSSEQQSIDVVVATSESLHKPLVVNDVTLEARTRYGIAYFPDHGASANILLQNTRKAQYHARRTRSLYAVYSPEADQNCFSDLALVSDLRRAINENRLYLLYQPKVDLGSRRVVGVEALARWNHPRLGMIPPARFIPLAERTGLITPLTLWSVEQAIQQWRAWTQDGLQLHVAVNLSMQNSSVAELWDRLFDQLASARISRDQLQLEITESVVMMNPSSTLQNMKRLKELGVGFSIDDFGIGYSSLAYLKRLPIDEIKIDKSFVMHSAAETEDAAIVNLIVQMGHELGLKLVAEGVEDQQTMGFLRHIGCDMAQGYHISRPIAARDLTAWLNTWLGDGAHFVPNGAIAGKSGLDGN